MPEKSRFSLVPCTWPTPSHSDSDSDSEDEVERSTPCIYTCGSVVWRKPGSRSRAAACQHPKSLPDKVVESTLPPGPRYFSRFVSPFVATCPVVQQPVTIAAECHSSEPPRLLRHSTPTSSKVDAVIERSAVDICIPSSCGPVDKRDPSLPVLGCHDLFILGFQAGWFCATARFEKGTLPARKDTADQPEPCSPSSTLVPPASPLSMAVQVGCSPIENDLEHSLSDMELSPISPPITATPQGEEWSARLGPPPTLHLTEPPEDTKPVITPSSGVPASPSLDRMEADERYAPVECIAPSKHRSAEGVQQLCRTETSGKRLPDRRDASDASPDAERPVKRLRLAKEGADSSSRPAGTHSRLSRDVAPCPGHRRRDSPMEHRPGLSSGSYVRSMTHTPTRDVKPLPSTARDGRDGDHKQNRPQRLDQSHLVEIRRLVAGDRREGPSLSVANSRSGDSKASIPAPTSVGAPTPGWASHSKGTVSEQRTPDVIQKQKSNTSKKNDTKGPSPSAQSIEPGKSKDPSQATQRTEPSKAKENQRPNNAPAASAPSQSSSTTAADIGQPKPVTAKRKINPSRRARRAVKRRKCHNEADFIYRCPDSECEKESRTFTDHGLYTHILYTHWQDFPRETLERNIFQEILHGPNGPPEPFEPGQVVDSNAEPEEGFRDFVQRYRDKRSAVEAAAAQPAKEAAPTNPPTGAAPGTNRRDQPPHVKLESDL